MTMFVRIAGIVDRDPLDARERRARARRRCRDPRASVGSCSRTATRPAAATTPAWRIAPPSSFRARRARAMYSASPASTEPTGALRPFERQIVTLSACARERGHRHAEGDRGVRQARPVDVQRETAAIAELAQPRHLILGGHRPARAVVRVLDHHERGARVMLVGAAQVAARQVGTQHAALSGHAPRHHVGDRRHAARPRSRRRVPPARRSPRRPVGRASSTRSGSPWCRSGRAPSLLAEQPATSISSSLTVGSAPYMSSPTRASRIASRIASVGIVAVS